MTLHGARKREYQLNWVQTRRREWIEENGPCEDCGTLHNLRVVHVDKKPGDMKTAAIWGLSPAKRNVELAKCVVLCKSCHYKRLAATGTWGYQRRAK